MSAPKVRAVGDETGAIILTHREYIGDIYGPANNFSNQVFALNPGLNSVFPWLAQIASNYEEYEFKQLLFSFRSTTTDIGSSTTGQCGTVVMCTNYNASAQPFTDKQQMVEYAYAHSVKSTESMEHGVECDPKKLNHNKLYVRNAPLGDNQDIKTYDHGLFQIAVCNSPSGFANNPIGELWVYYSVTLRKPKLFSGRGLDILGDYFTTSNTLVSTNPLLVGELNSTNGIFNALAADAIPSNLLACEKNSLGGTITTTAVRNQLKYTFPNNFVGAIRVSAYMTQLNAASGGTGVASIALNFGAFSFQGNFQCMGLFPGYKTNGDGTQINSGYGLNTSTALSTNAGVVGNQQAVVTDVYVYPPTPGSRNFFIITYPQTTTNTTAAVRFQVALLVQQYCSFIETPTSPVQFTRLATGEQLTLV
jgi:hypothetical protein